MICFNVHCYVTYAFWGCRALGDLICKGPTAPKQSKTVYHHQVQNNLRLCTIIRCNISKMFPLFAPSTINATVHSGTIRMDIKNK